MHTDRRKRSERDQKRRRKSKRDPSAHISKDVGGTSSEK